MNNGFYPDMYDASESVSRSGQRRYTRTTKLRLIALFTAAVGGAASWKAGDFDLFGVLGFVAFAVALAAEYYLLATNPDKLWYEARTVAESTKTLTWRYATGGDPFPIPSPDGAAEETMLTRLGELAEDPDTIIAADKDDNEYITTGMRALRERPFEERKEAYKQDRIVDQETWYKGRAAKNARLWRTFTWLAIVLEFAGLTSATLKAFSVADIDLLGIMGGAAAGLAAWVQAQNYADNMRSYTVTFRALGIVKARLAKVPEPQWAQFVEEAEEAISREHTSWRASRGLKTLAPRPRPMPAPGTKATEPKAAEPKAAEPKAAESSAAES